MQNETVTLVVGLAGIVATLISSFVGFYFISKERSASLRSALFTKQIDLITEINSKMSRFRVYATILSDKESPFLAQAEQDLRTTFKEFCELEEKGSVLFPVELWANLKETNNIMSETISELESNNLLTDESLKKLIGAFSKSALISRNVTGADELTRQAIGIFSSRKSFKNISQIDSKIFEKLVVRKNA